MDDDRPVREYLYAVGVAGDPRVLWRGYARDRVDALLRYATERLGYPSVHDLAQSLQLDTSRDLVVRRLE
jgi:hypothetical protein